MRKKARRLVSISIDGFSLIELLIVMAIVGVVMGAIYGVFISSNRSYRIQDRVASAQHSVRVGVDFMVRDIRMAGLDPRGDAGAGIIKAEGQQVRFTADRDLKGSIDDPDLSDGEINTSDLERMAYEYDGIDTLEWVLYKADDAVVTRQTLANNVTALSFTYLDADDTDLGDPVAGGDLDDIRTVVISMTVQERDKRGNLIEGTQRRLNKRVRCRNL